MKLKGEFPNAQFQLWPGQFVNVRLKVETLSKAVVVPTSAVQRGPIGTFSYVIGEDNIVTAKPVVVTQQNETQAVIASGLSPSDRVVTTGFANLSDGARVIIGRNDQTPSADLGAASSRIESFPASCFSTMDDHRVKTGFFRACFNPHNRPNTGESPSPPA